MTTVIVPKRQFAPQAPERLAVSINEAAAMLGVSEKTVRNWINREELQARKTAGRVLIPMTSLHDFLESRDR